MFQTVIKSWWWVYFCWTGHGTQASFCFRCQQTNGLHTFNFLSLFAPQQIDYVAEILARSQWLPNCLKWYSNDFTPCSSSMPTKLMNMEYQCPSDHGLSLPSWLVATWLWQLSSSWGAARFYILGNTPHGLYMLLSYCFCSSLLNQSTFEPQPWVVRIQAHPFEEVSFGHK